MKHLLLSVALCGLLATSAHAQSANPMMQRTMQLLDLAAGIEGYKSVCPQAGYPKMSDQMFDNIIMRLAGQGLPIGADAVRSDIVKLSKQKIADGRMLEECPQIAALMKALGGN